MACEEAFDPQQAREQYLRDIEATAARRGYVTYDFTYTNHIPDDAIVTDGSVEPGDDVTVRIELKLYTSGSPSMARVDLRELDDGFGEQHPETITVLIGSAGELTCSTASGDLLDEPDDSSAPACIPSEKTTDGGAGIALLVFPFLYGITDPAPLDDVPLSAMRTRRELDRRTHCYRFEAPDSLPAGARPPDDDNEVCYAEDGILVSSRGESPDQSVHIRATAAGNVTDADFEPPYPIVDPD